MSKYRFKTEEEFKKEKLWNENYPQGWNMFGKMNKYLGQDVPEKFNRACDDKVTIEYDGWEFYNQDYVLKESVSQYTKGKWYGCKGWSSKNDFVKLTKVVDGQAYFTEHLNDGNYYSGIEYWWSFNNITYPLFEADMSIVSPLLPDGHPDKIVAEEHKQEEKIDMQAIQEEAEEYERIGKSYDVTTLKFKEESIPEYVECIRSDSEVITVGKIYNWPNPIDDKGYKRSITTLDGLVWGFKPSTKEAYEAQFAPKKLTIEEWCDLDVMYVNKHTSIEKETFIDNVQSVNVTLRTKKKTIKF